MAAGTYRTVATGVAYYLLYATLGLLALQAGGVAVPRSVVLGSTLVVTVAFGVLAATGYVFFPRPDDDRRPGAAPDRRQVLLVLGGLLVVGVVLRGYALDVQSLWFDEAITANAAIALLEGGRPTFPSGYTYWRAFPQTLAVAASMALFGTGEAAARLPSVVFGLATIPATYWLGRQVGGRTIGLLAAALLTFLTWEIAWARQARMYQLLQLLYVLSLVSLLRVDRNGFGDRRGVASLVVVVALAAATHQIGYVLVPVAVVFLGLAATVDGRLGGRAVGGLVVGSGAFLLAFELAGPGVSATLADVATADVDYLGAYGGWLSSEFGALLYLGLIGAALTFYRGRYRAGALLALAVAPPIWVLSFHTELFATRYLYFAVPVLLVWAAVTVVYAARKLASVAREATVAIGSSGLGRRLRRIQGSRIDTDGGRWLRPSILTVVVGFLALYAVGGGFTVVPGTEYDLGVNAPQPEFRSAYEYVNANREPGDVIVAGWTAPGLYYAGGVDYWLAHDLTGTGERWTHEGRERYAGAQPVRGPANLRAVIESHDRGWVVVDAIVRARTGVDPEGIESVTRFAQFGDVTVYRWSAGSANSREPRRAPADTTRSAPGRAPSTPGTTEPAPRYGGSTIARLPPPR